MRLVHLSDTHLGFRQFERQTPDGINQREDDVAQSFHRAIDKIIELSPDLVVIAGDVFHAVRPSNPSILHAHAEFSRLVCALPAAAVVMVAGNHDTPRTRETGCILPLFASLGITVVEGQARRLTIRKLDLSILAVPDLPALQVMEPDPAAKYNVLLIHGEIEGVIPHTKNGITKEALGASRWNYIALGHWHMYQQVDENAYYSGSIDYTSSNPWFELAAEKGLIEQDLSTGEHTFHPLRPLRQLVDIPPVSGAGLSPAALDEQIRAAVDSVQGGIDGKVVRLLVRDVPRHMSRDLDYKAIRGYKRRALNFNLDTRRPETLRLGVLARAPGARRPSLLELVGERLRSRSLTDNVDKEGLVALGEHYMREAELVASPDGNEDAR